MSVILSLQQDMGLDDEQMAALLSDRLGRNISTHGYRTMTKRKAPPPAAWLDVLDLSPQEPGAGGAPSRPARPAPTEKPVAELSFNVASARTQLTMIYTFAGKGAATLTRTPEVATIWSRSAPAIADCYIRWAQVNPTVAQVLGYLTLGGPGGELALLHAELVVGTLIVSGRLDVGSFIPPTTGGGENGAAAAATDDDEGEDDPEPGPQPAPQRRGKRATGALDDA